MSARQSLSLPGRFELTHRTFSHPGRLVRLLGSIILILFSTINGYRDQFPMRNTITSQLIRNDLPRLTAMASQ